MFNLIKLLFDVIDNGIALGQPLVFELATLARTFGYLGNCFDASSPLSAFWFPTLPLQFMCPWRSNLVSGVAVQFTLVEYSRELYFGYLAIFLSLAVSIVFGSWIVTDVIVLATLGTILTVALTPARMKSKIYV
jgi:hypothetical protein